MLDTAPLEDVLRRDPDIRAAWLLGSAARDTLRAGSDVDIALLLGPGLRMDGARRLELVARLTRVLGRPADVGILSADNVVYAAQAAYRGRRFFARDPAAADLAMSDLLGLYDRFQTERKELIDAYHA